MKHALTLSAALLATTLSFTMPDQGAISDRRLEKIITLPKGLNNQPLRHALDEIEQVGGLEIWVDRLAFKKVKRNDPSDLHVRHPKVIQLQLAVVLRLLLGQVNATFALDARGDIIVVPMKDGRATEFQISPDRARRQRELNLRLAQPVTLEKGADENTPLRDLLEFLSDRYDITILIDAGAFSLHHQDIEAVETQPTQLPPLPLVPLDYVLDLIMDQIGGTYEIQDDAVIILPRKK